MPTEETLKSMPPDALWEFIKWLAFGQGRLTGIRVSPVQPGGDRVRRLAESVLLAEKQPEDEILGVRPPVITANDDDGSIVFAIARYVAARQVQIYRDAADFEPQDADFV